jgi:hypothetical protein
VPCGEFGAWTATRDMARDTAVRLMAMARRVEENPKITEFGLPALRELSPRSVSQSVGGEALAAMSSGVRITAEGASFMVARHQAN